MGAYPQSVAFTFSARAYLLAPTQLLRWAGSRALHTRLLCHRNLVQLTNTVPLHVWWHNSLCGAQNYSHYRTHIFTTVKHIGNRLCTTIHLKSRVLIFSHWEQVPILPVYIQQERFHQNAVHTPKGGNAECCIHHTWW